MTLPNTSVITIERFIMDRERQIPEATGELSNLLYDIALAAKIIAAAIRLTDPGPAFFRQRRVGPPSHQPQDRDGLVELHRHRPDRAPLQAFRPPPRAAAPSRRRWPCP